MQKHPAQYWGRFGRGQEVIFGIWYEVKERGWLHLWGIFRRARVQIMDMTALVAYERLSAVVSWMKLNEHLSSRVLRKCNELDKLLA